MKMIQERLKLAEDRIREIAQEEGRIEGLPFFTFLASKITDLLAYARKISKDGFVENCDIPALLAEQNTVFDCIIE